MLTQKQVVLECLAKHVEEYLLRDVTKIYTSRILKAQQLVIDQKVIRQPDGTFLIQGRREAPYKVNSSCECTEYVQHQAPKDWCKHRIAAQMYLKVLDDLETRQRQGIPHFHFVCDHKTEMELCWQVACPEPMDQLCHACLSAMKHIAESEEPPDALSQTPPEILKALAAPPYEEAPTPARPKILRAAQKQGAQSPMPEAPGSLNLKLKLPGGGELMYTMRSMKRGPAGDKELAERLPAVLHYLEGLGSETVTPHGSWWRRLLESLRLPHNGQGNF